MMLSEEEQALITGRIVEMMPWQATMVRAGLGSIPATMRALRRAVRRLVLIADPALAKRLYVLDP